MNEAAITVSFKTPTQTSVTLRADDEEQLDELLAILGRSLPNVGQVEKVLSAMENIYAGMSPVEKIKQDAERAAAAPAGAPQAAQGAPQGGQSQSGGVVKLAPGQASPSGEAAPICGHGPMYWKEFTSKAGKPIKGFFCTPNVDGCKPQFRY